MARQKAARCTHGHGRSLCFECFRAGSERTRARQEAWAQRTLPFDPSTLRQAQGRPEQGRGAPGSGHGAEPSLQRKLSASEIAHRRRMLEYLQATARRRTSA